MKKIYLCMYIVVLIFGGCFTEKEIKIDSNTSQVNINDKIYYIFKYPLYTLINGKQCSLKNEELTINYCGNDSNIYCSWNKGTGNVEIKIEETYFNKLTASGSIEEAYITCYSSQFFMNSFNVLDLVKTKYGVIKKYEAVASNYFEITVSGMTEEGILILRRSAGGKTISNKYYIQKDATYNVRDVVSDYDNSDYETWARVPLEIYVLNKKEYGLSMVNYLILGGKTYQNTHKVSITMESYPAAGSIAYIPFVKKGDYIEKTKFPAYSAIYLYQEDAAGNTSTNYVRFQGEQEKAIISAKYLNISQINKNFLVSFYQKDKSIVTLLDLEKNLDMIKPLLFQNEISGNKIENLYNYEEYYKNLTLDYSYKNKIVVKNNTGKSLYYLVYDINKISKVCNYLDGDSNFYLLDSEVDISKSESVPYILIFDNENNVMKISRAR